MTRRTDPSEWPTCFSSEGAVRRSIGDPRGVNNEGSPSAPGITRGGRDSGRRPLTDAPRYTTRTGRQHVGGPQKLWWGRVSGIPSVNGFPRSRGYLLPSMTPVVSEPPVRTVAIEPDEAARPSERIVVPARSEDPTYPCPRCGSIVRAGTALHVEDLRYVGWTACRVATYLNWCGHLQTAIPWPQADGTVRLIPVLRRGDLMPGVYVDLRDFVAQHSVCGRPAGDADALSHGFRVWARCPCGARFERWVAADEAEADLLRSALHDSRSLQPRIQ